MIRLTHFAALLLCVIQATVSQAASCGTPAGVWLHENKRIRVEITSCGERLCGKIVWLKNPGNEKGVLRTDSKNPDLVQRSRPIVGMPVIWGLVRNGPCVWNDGTIYNADDGETYSARVTIVGSDKLRVRAYVIFPLFGETQVWTRVSVD